MTRLKTLFLILSFGICGASKGQVIDPTEYWLSFYPLETGILWQFDGVYPISSSTPRRPFREIVGDTLLSNGKWYSIIHEGFSRSSDYRRLFERVDTTSLMVWKPASNAELYGFPDNEMPLWLLPNGDVSRSLEYGLNNSSFVHRIQCDWTTGEEVIGVEYLAWTCVNNPGSINSNTVKMAQGIGVFYRKTELEGPPPFYDILRYTNVYGYDLGIHVGVESLSPTPKSETLKIFPNPVQPGNILHVHTPQLFTHVTIEIYDLAGRRVMRSIPFEAGSQFQITIPSNLKSGIYLGLIRGDGHIASFKVVVQPH